MLILCAEVNDMDEPVMCRKLPVFLRLKSSAIAAYLYLYMMQGPGPVHVIALQSNVCLTSLTIT